ncbi:hypothetical protein MTO96_015858 [Rhipicephalus appendiculatus]
MRLLLYSILACLLICVIADNENEESQERSGFGIQRPQQPTPRGQPVARKNTLAKNRGAQGGRRHRCTLKFVQSKCTATLFVQRWAYSGDTNTCESINFPICWEKSGVFLTCGACMNTCIKEYKDGPEKRKWIQKHCQKIPGGYVDE